MLAIPVARSPRTVIAAAAGLLLLIVIAAILAWHSRQDGPGQSARPATRLQDLPARPEDIEAHGEQARSLLAPGDARAKNAAAPFAEGRLGASRPFVFQGSEDDRSRALQCLAAAVLYEAGDDTVGQAAVAQVVLNRVRHPAFPATVCGVVYQGSQRATGCQFTFTCDGSLRRQMPEAAWRRARDVAARALAGRVDDTVGLATHYHTDWVYPYWSPSLRKLARVGTHLFFGWPGSWGGPAAFRQAYRGGEGAAAGAMTGLPETAAALPDIGPGPPKILGLPQPPAQLPVAMGKVQLHGSRVRLIHPSGHAFGLLAPPGGASANLVDAAAALCRQPGPCQVAAWSNEDDIPGEYPIPAGARGTMVFEYVRDAGASKGSARFDCQRYPDQRQCLPAAAKLPSVLSGVRWKTN